MYEQKLFFHYMLIFLFYVKVPSDSQILENTLVQHICMNKSSADLSVEHMSDEKKLLCNSKAPNTGLFDTFEWINALIYSVSKSTVVVGPTSLKTWL